MYIKHDNFKLKYKEPFGAVAEDTKVKFRIEVDKRYKSCKLRLWTSMQYEELYEMSYFEDEQQYEIDIKIINQGLNWYYFIIEDFDGKIKYYGTKNGYTAGEGQEMNNVPYDNSFQITCYDKNFKVPEWFKGQIMYQIFPDRFCRDKSYEFDTDRYTLIHDNWNDHLGCTKWGANNFEFFGGNIKGIINKIKYLKRLNIGTIYLNPIFKSRSNHRYDVATFMEMDEMLGLQSDFKKLTKICHENGIKVIIDVSWNHTGDDSVYFNKYGTYGLDGAYKNPNSNYRNWYNIYPNGQYDCWWGFDSLPVINKNNTNYRTHVQEVIKHWVKMGIDGFRVDVIDELPDGFLKWFRRALKDENPELVVFGECWDDATLKKDGNGKLRSFLYGKSQDSIMNYVLRNYIVSFITYGYGEKECYHTNVGGSEFVNRIMNLFSNYPKDSVYCAMNFLSTHDINRILTTFGEAPWPDTMTKEQQGKYKLSEEKYELAIKRMKLAWTLICMLPGNPSIYYGDEMGSEGYNDPFNRKPMRWSHPDNNLLNWTRDMNTFRTNNPILKTADFNLFNIDEDVIGVERFENNKKIVCLFNRSNDKKSFIYNGYEVKINPISYYIINE